MVAAVPIALAFSGWGKASGESRETIGSPLRSWVGVGSGLAVVSGIFLWMWSMADADSVPGWHALIGIKVLLAIALMFLASAVVGRAAAFERFRSGPGLKLSALVAFAVILIALYLGHGG